MTDTPITISDAIDTYVALEEDIQAAISGLFGNVCALCTSTCCTPDICEESCDSAFLRAVRQRHEPDAMFCERFGWLTERGCALQHGRPPVCYGFFCNEIVEALSEQQRSVIRILGRLLSWVGERAIGPQHIVEPTNVGALGNVKLSLLLERIDVAREALSGVKAALNGEHVSEVGRKAMRQVTG
jgi:hypothetical protein